MAAKNQLAEIRNDYYVTITQGLIFFWGGGSAGSLIRHLLFEIHYL